MRTHHLVIIFTYLYVSTRFNYKTRVGRNKNCKLLNFSDSAAEDFAVERERNTYTHDESGERDKVVTRPAVGCEGAESLVANPVLQAARQTYLLFHKQCRVPGDSARQVALSGCFNQVVPQALCRNYSLSGFSGNL